MTGAADLAYGLRFVLVVSEENADVRKRTIKLIHSLGAVSRHSHIDNGQLDGLPMACAKIQQRCFAVSCQYLKSSLFQGGGDILQDACLTIGNQDDGIVRIWHTTHYMPSAAGVDVKMLVSAPPEAFAALPAVHAIRHSPAVPDAVSRLITAESAQCARSAFTRLQTGQIANTARRLTEVSAVSRPKRVAFRIVRDTGHLQLLIRSYAQFVN